MKITVFCGEEWGRNLPAQDNYVSAFYLNLEANVPLKYQ
jgi:hypothetical protein